MDKDYKNNIKEIVLGIRFSRSFRVLDISGDIIDNILYSKETPFGIKTFPNIRENSFREKTLYDPEKSNYLRINTDDLILGIEIEEDSNFEKKFSWLKEDVLKYFYSLFNKYEIKNIHRIGIVFSHQIGKNKKLNNLVNSLTGNVISEVENINLSFSKKLPLGESLIGQTKDYKNTIYNFNEKEGSIFISLDYQRYYEPIIQDIRDVKAQKFLEEAEKFLFQTFYKSLLIYEQKKEETK